LGLDWQWEGKAAPFVAPKNRGKNGHLGGGVRHGRMMTGDRAAHCNGSAQLHSSTTPQPTTVWLDVGRIGLGMEKWLCYVVRIFGFFSGGGILRHTETATGRTKSITLPSLPPPRHHNNECVVGCGLRWKGEGAAALFLRGKID
jgi:hypothetical protein